MAGRLATVRMRAGDILVLQGARAERCRRPCRPWACLPLAEREVRLGGMRHALLPTADPGRGHAAGGVRRAAGGRRPSSRRPSWWSPPAPCVCARPMRPWTPRCWCWWPRLIPVSDTVAGQRRDRPDRRLAVGRVPRPAAAADPGGGDGRGDGGHAVPEQRRHGADRGSDRRWAWPSMLGLQPGPVPDGRGGGGGLRLPHADRPPVQHPGYGPRRLSVRRLPAGWARPRQSSSWSSGSGCIALVWPLTL